jgi:uncharacterized protein
MNSTADSIFQFNKMLKNLDQCMKKASAYADHKKFEVNVLAESRLAPDMYSFIKQIQSTCDSAKFCAAYLSGQTAPKHEDNETTWSQLHERIRKVVTYLEGFNASSFENAAKIQVKPGWAKGQWIQGDKYLNEIAIPNFYFHLMAAYAIMRHAGVDIGKMDYMGQVSLQ